MAIWTMKTADQRDIIEEFGKNGVCTLTLSAADMGLTSVPSSMRKLDKDCGQSRGYSVTVAYSQIC